MQEIPYDWLRLVEQALAKVEQLPPLEENFPFPWSDASQAVQAALELPQMALSATKVAWKGPQDQLQGMGDRPAVISIEITPVEGLVYFALPKQDVAHLTAEAATAGQHKEGFSNAKLQEGFYHFLWLKVIEAIDHLKVFKEVSFNFAPASSLPQENGFCIDIDCTLSDKTLKGRLICPQTFLAAFKAHHPIQKGTLLSSDAIHGIEVTLRTEVGTTSISSEEWEKINVGDFLILDRCSYDPYEGKGSVSLLLGETPLLMARIKPEGMKILDYALYQEETPQDEKSFSLKAEIGRIRMPLSKLLHVEPGAMLEITARPEQGVDIMVGGKKVAKGELLKLGETAGLRILDIER